MPIAESYLLAHEPRPWSLVADSPPQTAALHVRKSPKFSSINKIGVEEHVTSDFRPEVEIRLFRACAIKIYIITLIYGRIAEIFAS